MITSLDSPAIESSTSAVSWPAIFAGGIVAIAASLVLAALGSGLGWAALSPWPYGRANITTVTAVTGIWLVVTQWIAAALGGYMTGRLRTRWTRVHDREVFFRDTAHGFLTWCLATLATVLLLGAIAGVVGGAGVAAGAAGAMQNRGINGPAPGEYDLDVLFRSDRADANPGAQRAEALRILAKGFANGDVNSDDRTRLTHIVAAQTGVADDEAQHRVDSAITKTRDAAAAARKAAMAGAFFTALSMMIGAFIACVSAVLGGRLRDEDEHVPV